MLRRLGSLRLWLVAAMTVAAVTGLVAARFVIAGIEKRDELAKDRRKAELVAASIAAQVGAGATPARLQIMQSVLPNSQIVVYRGNKLVLASSPRHHDGLELTVTNPVPGGEQLSKWVLHLSAVGSGCVPWVSEGRGRVSRLIR